MIDKKSERKQLLEAVTRQHILDAAVKVMTRDGISALTMDKVAAKAHVAKGTLYVHFQNKQEIIDAAIEESIAPLVDALSDILDNDLAPADKLRQVALYHMQFCDTHSDLFRVILYDQQHTSDETKRFRSDRYWTFMKRVARVVEQGITTGVFRPMDPARVAIMFIEASRAVMVQRLSSNNTVRIEHDAGLVLDIFLHGISTDVPAAGSRIDNR